MPILIVAQVRVNEFERHLLFEYHAQIQRALEGLEGYRSMTLWQALDNPEHYILLSDYADLDAAQHGFVRIGEQGSLMDKIDSMEAPPDVHQVAVQSRQGKRPAQIEVGQLMSVSRQIAPPAMGQDVEQRLEDIFYDLSLLPGFLGSAAGWGTSMEDEIMGLAFWTDLNAYRGSMPENASYPIRVFQKEA
jgi:heme-degrading monooxygenase HmoA